MLRHLRHSSSASHLPPKKPLQLHMSFFQRGYSETNGRRRKYRLKKLK
uniref:Uncharacterized protein n=1 Tax=Rhizophora mucronata TaxID=61149 RepID=A0A2P2R467_RHIMU